MIELGDGLFIETSEELMEQQKGWADEDPGREIDFTTYPFWLTADDGQEPEGYDSVQEIKDFVGKL